mmetsp:Transcript_153457/g.286025  ORF Transcript_153457/g.286025 Transcript_153457/m.286025 type:complete len:209 (-) Transcript_153457:1597-2223(-)
MAAVAQLPAVHLRAPSLWTLLSLLAESPPKRQLVLRLPAVSAVPQLPAAALRGPSPWPPPLPLAQWLQLALGLPCPSPSWLAQQMLWLEWVHCCCWRLVLSPIPAKLWLAWVQPPPVLGPAVSPAVAVAVAARPQAQAQVQVQAQQPLVPKIARRAPPGRVPLTLAPKPFGLSWTMLGLKLWMVLVRVFVLVLVLVVPPAMGPFPSPA